jgi:geranylgeranyl diphosphate synthase type II
MNKGDFKLQIEQSLKTLFSSEQKAAINSQSRELISLTSKVILDSGKRFRPTLFELTYSLYGGKDNPKLIDIGMSVELFHQALLFHDDVIDEDTFRNGKPNVIGIYKQKKQYFDTNIPQSMAILAGDYLLNLINKIILSSKNLNDSEKLKILGIFSESFKFVIFGQQMDSLNMNNLISSLTSSDLVEITINKTAHYTTILPMELAVTVLNIDNEELIKINKFATNLGVYYQLVNDYEDYFKIKENDEYVLRFSDYEQGKITFVYLIAVENLKTDDLDYFKAYFATKKIDKAHKNRLIEILVDNGISAKSAAQALEYLDSAQDDIRHLNISKSSKLRLAKLLENIKI